MTLSEFYNTPEAPCGDGGDAGEKRPLGYLLALRAFSDSNLRILSAVALCLIAVIAFKAQGRTAAIDSRGVVRNSSLPLIVERINVNTAGWASLCRLPGIGPVRAKSICNYRQQAQAGVSGAAVFTCPEDLTKVYGIGPVTAERASRWLVFDAPAADMSPVPDSVPLPAKNTAEQPR